MKNGVGEGVASDPHDTKLYISCTVSNFYGREIEICAGFGPVGSSEKKLGQLCVYMGKKNCSVDTKIKVCN